MVRSDRDVGVLGHDIEKFLHHAVQVLHRLDLPVAQHLRSSALSKNLSLPLDELPADHLIVQVLEDAVNAADARPFFGRFVGQRVRIVGFADVQQVERRAVLRKRISRTIARMSLCLSIRR